MMKIWAEFPNFCSEYELILHQKTHKHHPFLSGARKHMKIVYTYIHLPLIGINCYLVLIGF